MFIYSVRIVCHSCLPGCPIMPFCPPSIRRGDGRKLKNRYFYCRLRRVGSGKLILGQAIAREISSRYTV
ncbi:MAG: hypothetical protein FJY65_07165 [Calditrichaeota bacterium]|nr:hypothetical protein [Calditrichota bacterium]